MRAAIYCRKSTEDGLAMEFNSLDAQQECGEGYAKSQQWKVVSTHYHDGGFSGGNMDRPALRRLMADIEAGKIDVIIVYKLDRLSRSLIDFCKMLEVFEKHKVAFVSATQRIDTSTPMGKLMINVLMSFAEFERGIISERTRDKVAASRKRGQYIGGRPVLGYDVHNKKLVVNPDEAKKVQTIFQLYLDHRSLIAVAAELNARGWQTKSWTTRAGKVAPGLAFNKTNLHALLTNPLYIGRVRYKAETFPGEHQAIISEETWSAVQTQLSLNGSTGGAKVRNKFGALLKGLLYCSSCKCAMSPSHTTKANRRYRYYVCTNAQKTGWSNCPSKSVTAKTIEDFVVDQIRNVGQDPTLVAGTIEEANRLAKEELGLLDAELRRLKSDVQAWTRELPNAQPSRQADLHERLAAAERRATELHEERSKVLVIDPDDVAERLKDFDGLWSAMTPVEQIRVVELLVSRVDYCDGRVVVTFNPSGILALEDAA